jgi:hypothetical protein
MDAYRAVVDKRDRRAYLGRPIADEALRRILPAGRMTGGSCPAHLREAAVAALLGIPSDLAVNRVIGFGYVDPEWAGPPASVARRRRPLTELVHWTRW